MKIVYAAAFLIGTTTVSACLAADPQNSVPARLDSPSPEVRQQLRDVTAKMLGLSTIVMAENTLTKDSRFIFIRTPRFDASGQLLQGRVIEPGHIFKLVLHEDGCWLIYQNKNQQEKLTLAKCVPE
jgi:hypothetical protein